MNFEEIEEAVKEKMREIEMYERTKQSDSYFMLARSLKDYAWKCWRKGVNIYNEHQS